ncbi:unnamed protein product [Phytophthora fragariaefolia]|uniref:Unnamed protein product n=1 Tax=Phytophthora fragariaefolia TaxID=1490495 RepID=A0A9W6XQ34_9STRA|nr:unnamed protein product [Phytophthora fragariaefolia]
MLWNGGVEVNIYEVADSKLLIGLQKGLFVQDVMRFLDDQHDVQEYEWDGKDYPAGRAKHTHQKHRKKRVSKPQKTVRKPGKRGKHGKKAHRKQQKHPAHTAKTNEIRTRDEL